jgi:ankyrin repeat protein
MNVKDENGNTLLGLAAENGHENVVKLFFERTDFDKNGTDAAAALGEAAKSGHENAAKLILGKGTDLNLRDFAGRTPLWNAIFNVREKMMRLLLDRELQGLYAISGRLQSKKWSHAGRYKIFRNNQVLTTSTWSIDDMDD